jgi:hypothetical protein
MPTSECTSTAAANLLGNSPCLPFGLVIGTAADGHQGALAATTKDDDGDDDGDDIRSSNSSSLASSSASSTTKHSQHSQRQHKAETGPALGPRRFRVLCIILLFFLA